MGKSARLRSLLAGLLFIVCAMGLQALLWHRGAFGVLDYMVLDRMQRYAIQSGLRQPKSDRIIYITITDECYRKWGRSFLPRETLAEVNTILAGLDIEALVYDLILAQPQSEAADAAFVDSLQRNGRVYLPAGFHMAIDSHPQTRLPAAEQQINLMSQRYPLTHEAQPRFAGRSFLPAPIFQAAARGVGHVSVEADRDGVYRHLNLVLATRDAWIPAITLKVFQDLMLLQNSDVELDFGQEILFRARPTNRLEQDFHLPIDSIGRSTLLPPGPFDSDFEKIAMHRLQELARDPAMRGNLYDLFAGRIVLLGDVSTGIADAGSTSLENDVPLVALHAYALNGLLNRIAIRESAVGQVRILGMAMLLLVFLAYWRHSQRFLLLISVIALLGLLTAFIVLWYWQFLLPLLTVGQFSLALTIGLFSLLQWEKFQKQQIQRQEQLRNQQEMQIARQIQQQLLPPSMPFHPPYFFWALNRPAYQVGGDLYDAIELGDGRYFLLLGDVSGKGVPAALYMSSAIGMLRSMLLGHQQASLDLRTIVLHLNRLLRYNHAHQYKNMFISATFLLLHTNTGQLDVLRCGHEPAMLVTRRAGARPGITYLKPPGFVLGALDNPLFERSLQAEQRTLEPGQSLILYTDGITEAKNGQDEFLGLDRFESAVTEALQSHARLEAAMQAVLTAIDQWAGQGMQYDDMTMLALQRLPADSLTD
ncbi:MAG: SpoIIE family protein phosphatase [Leptospiraceae bacterium]|nr:SpoIIE family protein phosphatase [Leptospiraceae bacterium]